MGSPLHWLLRRAAGGYYRLCGHTSHRLHLPCFRGMVADGFCGRHLATCYQGCTYQERPALMPDVLPSNRDKPHRCPNCWAVAIRHPDRPRWWRVHTCSRCGARFTRWPRLARLLPCAHDRFTRKDLHE